MCCRAPAPSLPCAPLCALAHQRLWLHQLRFGSLRHPPWLCARGLQQLGAWMKYLDIKAKASTTVRFQLYERALKMLPGSYKLWYRYLKERRKAVRGLSPIGKSPVLRAKATRLGAPPTTARAWPKGELPWVCV